jgi:hypothetical protein
MEHLAAVIKLITTSVSLVTAVVSLVVLYLQKKSKLRPFCKRASKLLKLGAFRPARGLGLLDRGAGFAGVDQSILVDSCSDRDNMRLGCLPALRGTSAPYRTVCEEGL